jgi:adenylate kinase
MSVTVLVAGIHGAGKSTICRELARLLGAFRATAGDLIRANAKAEVTVGVKAVPNADLNQLLLRGLAEYLATNSGPSLLNGHFAPRGNRIIQIGKNANSSEKRHYSWN